MQSQIPSPNQPQVPSPHQNSDPGRSLGASPNNPDFAAQLSFRADSPQENARLFLAAQQRFDMRSQSPLSASASADQPGSGYQSSSAQSASGDPNADNSASTSAAGSRRPSSVGRKASGSHRSQKHRWSAEETQALVDGCNKHGVGNWKKILSDPALSSLFCDRTAGDLKDRFRTYFPDAYHEMYPNAKTHLSKAVRGRDAEGKSIFEKGKTKERRPFTAEEDAALRAGYQQYGSHWALIAKDPIFNGQRRAIDLRDRFRNAFPEDYERAGFKPRPSKARKDRGPSAAKPGEGHPARTGSLTGALSDHSLSEGGWRGADYALSDATSDGHLTDHGNLTDYSYFTDQGNLTDGGQEPIFSGPSSGASSALGRSNSMGGNIPRQSFGQALSAQLQQQQQQQHNIQPRPPFLSSNTAPLPGSNLPLRASDMVTGQSINSLFEQLQQASLEGTSTTSETSSIRERATPPSASEADPSHQQHFVQMHHSAASAHVKAASADDARRQAGKHAIHDPINHKRRSHASRTGKSSALERLPSVHGHMHGVHSQSHGHAHQSSASHSRPQSQSSSQHQSPAGGPVPPPSNAQIPPLSQTNAIPPNVLAWLGPSSQSMGVDESSMNLDDQRAALQAPSSWSTYSSSASDISGTSFNASGPSGFVANTQNLFTPGINFGGQPGITSPTGFGSNAFMAGAMSAASDSSASSAADSRRSSSVADPFAQQNLIQQDAGKPFANQPSQMRDGDFMVGPLQNFADANNMAQWDVDWADLGSISDSGLQGDDVNELLASLPLSHHPWAGDLHHGTTAAVAGEAPSSTAAQQSLPQGASRGQMSNDLSGIGFLGQGQAADQAMLRQMSALGASSQQHQHQQQQKHEQQSPTANSQSRPAPSGTGPGGDGGVSFATVTYGDPLVREEREGSPDSLELQREQTFTAKDVALRLAQRAEEVDKEEDDSDDDQRRRSTDTLRHVEGALEQALESVEDTRALAFAQQFHRDSDSDSDSDDEAEDDGYEEDEEDDDELDYELEAAAPDYNFEQALEELQASDQQLGGNSALSSDFFDGPFSDAITPNSGAPGPLHTGLDDVDLSQYTNSTPTAGNGATSAFLDMHAAGWSSSPGDQFSPTYGLPPNTGTPSSALQRGRGGTAGPA